jgi:tetrapyrrole methylase family protein/MazG family protein
MPGITLLGLGPGDPHQLTREAWEVLSSANEVYLRTRQHPTVNGFPSSVKIHSFDEVYDNTDNFEDVYKAINQKILELGRRPEGVIYAVPGHPFVAESTCPEIARLARLEGLQVHIVEGLSFMEPAFSALGIDPFPQLTLYDALTLGQAHIPAFPPDAPVMIAQIYSRLIASEVKSTLTSIYPDEHPVRFVHNAGTKDQIVENLPLFEIDRTDHIGLMSVLFVPSLGEGTSLEAFQEIVAHLRAPNGCPWDREQTHASLCKHMLEESYEAIAAIDSGDFAAMREEFGDLLLQIMLNSQIASEEGEFTVNDVLKGIYDKIIRRHPHVFGEVKVSGVDGVLANWEKLKEGERKDGGKPEKGILDGVPAALPALSQAQEYQDRAARVGFDWPVIDGVLDKVREEIEEIKKSETDFQLASELGDLFFVLVNLARWKKVDAESALRGTNIKFKKRFSYIEQNAKKQGRNLSDMKLEEMDDLWNEAKTKDL